MKINNFNKIIKDESGAVAIITAVVLFFVLIGIAALAIDIGRLATTKNELQNAADAAALAGAGELGRQYLYNEDYDEDAIKGLAKTTGEENKANNISITLNVDNDIKMGWWGSGFTPGPNNKTNPSINYNAVKVTITENNVGTFFAKTFGFDKFNTIKVEATASLTGPGYLLEAEINAPFGLSEVLFQTYTCGNKVAFNPSASCAGWHAFVWETSSSSIDNIMLDRIYRHDSEGLKSQAGLALKSGSEWLKDNFNINWSLFYQKTEFPSDKPKQTYHENIYPDIFQVGDEFDFQGGPISSLFNGDIINSSTYDGNTDGATVAEIEKRNNPAPFFAMFEYFRYRDGDGNDSEWSTIVPVYEESGACDQANTDTKIVGFANVIVQMPIGPPDKNIDVIIDCDLKTVEGRGGGSASPTNLFALIPNLVE